MERGATLHFERTTGWARYKGPSNVCEIVKRNFESWVLVDTTSTFVKMRENEDDC